MYDQEQSTLEFTESLDALPGHVLMAALEDEWFRAGVAAARSGQDSAVLWNHYQRAGHRAYTSAMQALKAQVQHA